MTKVRGRVAAGVGVGVLLVVSVFARAVIAQNGPSIPAGGWAGDVLFDRVDASDQGAVTYDGGGRLEFDVQSGSGGDAGLQGDFTFEVRVHAVSELADSDRTYRATWALEGFGDAADIAGDVAVIGLDSARTTAAEDFTVLSVEFETTGRGRLSVSGASCASASGDLVTEPISPPGARPDAGPGLFAPFVVFPTDSPELDNRILEIEGKAALIWEWLGSKETNNLDTRGAIIDEIRVLMRMVDGYNQALADLGRCGEISGEYLPGGNAHSWLAEMMLSFAFVIGVANDKVPNTVSANDLIDVYGLASRAGAFQIGNDEASALQDVYPAQLGTLLDDALLEGDISTVEAIHAAACQYGWEDLKRRSTIQDPPE